MDGAEDAEPADGVAAAAEQEAESEEGGHEAGEGIDGDEGGDGERGCALEGETIEQLIEAEADAEGCEVDEEEDGEAEREGPAAGVTGAAGAGAGAGEGEEGAGDENEAAEREGDDEAAGDDGVADERGAAGVDEAGVLVEAGGAEGAEVGQVPPVFTAADDAGGDGFLCGWLGEAEHAEGRGGGVATLLHGDQDADGESEIRLGGGEGGIQRGAVLVLAAGELGERFDGLIDDRSERLDFEGVADPFREVARGVGKAQVAIGLAEGEVEAGGLLEGVIRGDGAGEVVLPEPDSNDEEQEQDDGFRESPPDEFPVWVVDG